MLPDLLPIPPFTRPVRGEVTLPGSKSLTNRALLLAALCDARVTLTGALFSDDTAIMAQALRQLGFTIKEDEAKRTIEVEGRGGTIPARAANLHVGLAGTAARFLTALCAAAPTGLYHLDGVPQMRKRPMKGLIDSLRSLGADIRCPGEEGHFPLEIHARGLRGGSVEIDASESSQMLSALLMVAPLAREKITTRTIGAVRQPFVEMTVRQIAEFIGVASSATLNSNGPSDFTIEPGRYRSPGTYAIEPDATAGSYFAALPLVTRGSLLLKNLIGLENPSLQGDVRFLDVVADCGAQVMSRKNIGIEIDAPNPVPRVDRIDRDFSGFSDTFLTLAAIAPLLDGPTRITGIAHTRKQETDRVAGMARELKKLGQEVVEENDALTITPKPLQAGQTIETYGDHRFAMSFGILGCHDLLKNGKPWLTIKDPACCAKTFPNFFELLESLRLKSLET